MPATTRSKTKQSHLEDFQGPDSRNAISSPSRAPQRKRPADTKSDARSGTSPKKRSTDESHRVDHQTRTDESGRQTSRAQEPASGPILINRAPVLQLWSACVAQLLYPSLDWSTSLAVGAAVSALCAISKGRSIGAIEPADHSPDHEANKNAWKWHDEANAHRQVEVMGFKLWIKNGDVLVQGKPKKGSEGALKAKFGDSSYTQVKHAIDQAVQTWKGSETKLDHAAFGMYEQFRPSVPRGQGGWGRKGELHLARVKEVVQRD